MNPFRIFLIRKKRSRATAAQRAVFRKVRAVLRRRGLRVTVAERSGTVRRGRFDLVIAVGGDGTFLEAARGAREVPVLGVNSDPAHSVGSFCAATARTFEQKLEQVLKGRAPGVLLTRLQLRLNGRPLGSLVLNEVLVTHRKPAAMSRYRLQIGNRTEEHHSSGLWIATAAGSTGAIRSAGGQILPRGSRRIQYRPRELFSGGLYTYGLRGGVLPIGCGVRVRSLMLDGLICVDGEHMAFPFRAGDLLEISASAYPLHLIS